MKGDDISNSLKLRKVTGRVLTPIDISPLSDIFQSSFDKSNSLLFLLVLYFRIKHQKTEKKISDPLPLYAEFQINKLARELDQIIHPGP